MSKVFIGVPTHDARVGLGTARCLFNIGKTDAMVRMQARSLLALNFNDLLCQALNNGADYFLLLHADIEVTTANWLDRMIAIMKREKVDVLSVASPIKNTDDFSCGMSDANCFKRHRFSRDDLKRLPKTFKTIDVRKEWEDDALVMIFNTGCLLINLRKAQTATNYFQMVDKVERDESGNWTCDCVPEDWFFSVVCHKLAIPYACTREIELLHAGLAFWSNKL